MYGLRRARNLFNRFKFTRLPQYTYRLQSTSVTTEPLAEESPLVKGPLTTEPTTTEPTTTEPTTTEPTTKPLKTQRLKTQPLKTEPSGAEPSGAELSEAELSEAPPSGAEPSDTEEEQPAYLRGKWRKREEDMYNYMVDKELSLFDTTPGALQTVKDIFYSLTPEQMAKGVQKWKRPYVQGPLTEQEFEEFWTNGFVIKHNLLKRDQFFQAVADINDMVDDLAKRLHKAGKIKNLYENEGFYTRLTKIESEFPSASVLLHKKGVLPKGFQNIWASRELLGVAYQIIGPQFGGHPVWNLRSKTPGQEQATVPWHQDTAYLHPVCWDVLQLTAWVPLLNANIQNGCMQLARGGHNSGRTATHVCCAGGTWYVELSEEDMQKELGIDMKKDIVTCEVPMGSVLFLNNFIPHRSLPNTSNSIRWSLDLRWQDPNKVNGFYVLKETLPMWDDKEPRRGIDWTFWANLNRQKLQEKAQIKWHAEQTKDNEFDTTIAGPWMNLWNLVHHNHHTKSLHGEKTEWVKA